MQLSAKSIASSYFVGCAVGFAIFFVGFLALTTASTPRLEVEREQSSERGHHLSLSPAKLSQIMIAVTAVQNSPANICQFSQDQLMMLGQMIRPLLSERYAYDKDRLANTTSFPKDCASDCTCSYYIGFFEEAEAQGLVLNSEVRALGKSYSSQLATQDKRTSACMKDAEWVCTSPVIRRLQE